MHRGWMESSDFKPEPFTDREAFIWSVEQAAYEEHAQWFNGKPITVARGEFVTSYRQMAETFGWSVKRIRSFLKRMTTCGKWAQRTAHDGAQAPTLISVCNFDKYQILPKGKGTDEGTEDGTPGAQSGHTTEQQETTGKQQSPDGAGKGGQYAFAGTVIRLNDRDFSEWQTTYHGIPDLRAELRTLDSWHSQSEDRRVGWFHRVQTSLNKKHQSMLADMKGGLKARAPSREPEPQMPA